MTTEEKVIEEVKKKARTMGIFYWLCFQTIVVTTLVLSIMKFSHIPVMFLTPWIFIFKPLFVTILIYPILITSLVVYGTVKIIKTKTK